MRSGPGLKAQAGAVDPAVMRLLAAVAVALLAVASPAQERHSTARLVGGEVVAGRVLSFDERWLKLFVDGRVRTIDARKVLAVELAPAATNGPAADDAPVAAATTDPTDPIHAASAPAAPAHAADLPELAPAAPMGESKRPPTRTLPDPATPAGATAPVDLRQRTLLQARLEVVDARYPWLHPTLPVQWASYGLLLWIACAFAVRASAGICGAEAAPMGRSAGIAAWYLATVAAQVAYVPDEDFAKTVVLLANPAVALFLLRRAYGLTRVGATLAFAVQLGFAVVAFGALELVTSALGAVAAR